MTTALTTRHQAGVVPWTDEHRELARRVAGAGAGLSDVEFETFLYVARHNELDPLRKEIYAIQRGGKLTIQVSIDGLRKRALASGEYEGQTPHEWCGEDGTWRDVWLARTPPAAARVGVYRRGFRAPVYAVATYASYAQTSNGRPSGTWAEKPDVMLAKCAEAAALRRAFPAHMSGLVGEDEMAETTTTTAPPSRPAVVTRVQEAVVDADVVEPDVGRWLEAIASAGDEDTLAAIGAEIKAAGVPREAVLAPYQARMAELRGVGR